MSFFLEESERLKKLPPYLFVEIDRAKRRAIERGVRVIDFGVGDPDEPTPGFVLKSMAKAIRDPQTHRYPLDRGFRPFREAAAQWMKKRFQVTLDPDREILPLIGSKEGIAHLPLAFLNPGDVALIPNPSYPPYRSGTLFAGGIPYDLPLKETAGFIPDFKAVPGDILKKAKLIFVNYPNNPTGTVAPRRFYEELLSWASQHRILVVSDLAYSEIYFSKEKPASLFEFSHGKENGIEFHSLSKTCNMTGWRIGFAAGAEGALSGLLRVKSNLDSGVFTAIQKTAVDALKNSFSFSKKMNRLYCGRRNVLVRGLRALGFPVEANPATFYCFTRLPAGLSDSSVFCKALLDRAGVVATPGVGFGTSGEGYVRFALTVPEVKIKEALRRMKKVRWWP